MKQFDPVVRPPGAPPDFLLRSWLSDANELPAW
jgi:hypothetical protein